MPSLIDAPIAGQSPRGAGGGGCSCHRISLHPAGLVSGLIGKQMNTVRLLETEDRERTAGYMLEVWCLLGFKGATGRFAHGSGYPRPAGYGEPLPPGWTAPDKPRRMG